MLERSARSVVEYVGLPLLPVLSIAADSQAAAVLGYQQRQMADQASVDQPAVGRDTGIPRQLRVKRMRRAAFDEGQRRQLNGFQGGRAAGGIGFHQLPLLVKIEGTPVGAVEIAGVVKIDGIRVALQVGRESPRFAIPALPARGNDGARKTGSEVARDSRNG